MLADRTTIERYIPQRPPMVMVHGLLEVSEQHAVSSLVVEAENILVAGNLLSEPGLIENIAQTAAAQVGYLYEQKNQPVPVGFIAAIKSLVIKKLPPLGATLHTTVKVTNRVFDVTFIEGTVQHEGTVLCHCEMKIFTRPEQTDMQP